MLKLHNIIFVLFSFYLSAVFISDICDGSNLQAILRMNTIIDVSCNTKHGRCFISVSLKQHRANLSTRGDKSALKIKTKQ